MEWIEDSTNVNYVHVKDMEDIERIYKDFCQEDRIAIYNELLKEFEVIEDYEFCCEIRDKINVLTN